MPRIIIEHDEDCPLGVNGLRAYHEAREAFADTPPEARSTPEDAAALAEAEHELEEKQKCTCGADNVSIVSNDSKRPRGRCRKRWIETATVFCQLPEHHSGEHWSEVNIRGEDGKVAGRGELFWKAG